MSDKIDDIKEIYFPLISLTCRWCLAVQYDNLGRMMIEIVWYEKKQDL